MKKSDIGNVEKYGKFAISLKYLLVKNNITQGELASVTGLSEATISHYMKGKSTPSQTKLEKISECLGVTPQTFYSISDDFNNFTGVHTEFGNKISKLMRERGITQENLAKAIGVSRQTVNSYTNGKCLPMDTVMQKIADFFEMTVDELTNIEENEDETDAMQIVVTKMPKSKETCLFSSPSIMEGSFECIFGGICCLFDNKCPHLRKETECTTF